MVDETDAKRIAAFLRDIKNEIDACELLISANNRLAPYHIEQGFEKLLRAVMVHRGVVAGRDHRLTIMIQMLPAVDVWRQKLTPYLRYEDFATSFRYPTPGGKLLPAPDSSTMLQDLAALKLLLADAKKELQ